VEVKVSDEVMPGVISLPHGWGHDLPGIQTITHIFSRDGLLPPLRGF
jgi:anaerobic selenocysteine-containing dehydrogenase